MKSEKFRVDTQLDNAEKLALLNFSGREFNLGRLLSLAGLNTSVATQFVLEQFSSLNSKADFIYFDLVGIVGLDSLLLNKCIKLLSRRGIICVDGVGDTALINDIFRDVCEPVLETPGFFVFARRDGERPISSMRYQLELFRRKYFFEAVRRLDNAKVNRLPLVAVIVLAYQHEQYIAECLNSILIQKGDFRMRVIILDDASTDRTAQVVSAIIAGQGDDRVEFDFRSHPENIGMVKNFGESVRLAVGCEYLTFCEGDDFWSKDSRIQEHIDFLEARPACVMSFNTIERCAADGSSRELFFDHINNSHDIVDGRILAANNLCGNLAACFYDGALLEVIPEQLFDMYTGDWMFNMYCSQFGGIGHLKKPLSVYRQHDGGAWSMRPERAKLVKTLGLIEQYNTFLDFQYDEGFQEYKSRLLNLLSVKSPGEDVIFDLLVVDDIFPSSLSGFRLAEFTSYLHEFPRSVIQTSGSALPALQSTPLKEVIQRFQRKNPTLSNRVITSGGAWPMQLSKLVYVNFLTNAYAQLPMLEEAQVPFVFTLYPGAGLSLNNPECDRKLKRVFESPCFLKVIVTQQITYDYIVTRNLCPVDKVEMIFGVVMPQDAFVNKVAEDKPRWGFGKQRLDICFMAHRYTPHGEDKGYDVFINTAYLLRQQYDDIYFHVVGPFDSRVIDVASLRDRIEFHGSLEPEQFDGFFREMDIIMSPNISGKIFPGAFDGFPTASCTEAGLRGTAIFATDEFGSGNGRFTDGQDIVLIEYDLAHIVSKVEKYYSHPAELKAVGERGRHRIQDLYSYQSQMVPRIRILRELIEAPFFFHAQNAQELDLVIVDEKNKKLNNAVSSAPSLAWTLLSKYSPQSFKKFYRSYIRNSAG